MATVTNVHDLPEALVAAVLADPYKGGGDISATKLIDAPQRRVLSQRHADQISVDVSERIWALLGQGVHSVLERAEGHVKNSLAEERLFAKVDGWTISGQFDRLCLDRKVLQDYKVTTTFKADGAAAWTDQLNILRWLAVHNGYEVEKLEVVAIFRDWRKTECDRRADYPKAAAQIIPVPMWSLDAAYEFIRHRVALHQAAASAETLPPCTDDERWYSGTRYALMKPEGKRAVRVLDERPAPEDVPDGLTVIERPGVYRRCTHYCDVSPFCAQWAATPKATEE